MKDTGKLTFLSHKDIKKTKCNLKTTMSSLLSELNDKFLNVAQLCTWNSKLSTIYLTKDFTNAFKRRMFQIVLDFSFYFAGIFSVIV